MEAVWKRHCRRGDSWRGIHIFTMHFRQNGNACGKGIAAKNLQVAFNPTVGRFVAPAASLAFWHLPDTSKFPSVHLLH